MTIDEYLAAIHLALVESPIVAYYEEMVVPGEPMAIQDMLAAIAQEVHMDN